MEVSLGEAAIVATIGIASLVLAVVWVWRAFYARLDALNQSAIHAEEQRIASQSLRQSSEAQLQQVVREASEYRRTVDARLDTIEDAHEAQLGAARTSALLLEQKAEEAGMGEAFMDEVHHLKKTLAKRKR